MKITKPSRLPAKEKRVQLRDALWPGMGAKVWSRHENDGWTTIPRLLPLVMTLITKLTKKGDPSPVYFELWCRAFDEGIVTGIDPLSCAYSAGYSGTRAERTWREHVHQLEELGFIRIKAEGLREIAHILILNPIEVCAQLYRDKPKLIGDEWWTAFVKRASEVGAKLPDLNQE